MSVIAYVVAKRISPNKGVDFSVPRILTFDTAQLMWQGPNLKRGGCVIKFLDASRKSRKAELYEGLDQLNVAVDPNTTTNPNAIDLNLAVAAAGTTQGAATVLSNYLNKVTTAATGSAEGVKLPLAVLGAKPIVVINADASGDAVKVYPFSGDKINALAIDAAFSIPAGGRAVFVPTAALQWLTGI